MQNLLSLIARIMTATIFLLSGAGNKIPNFSGVAAYMASEGVPLPQLMRMSGWHQKWRQKGPSRIPTSHP